MEDFYELMRYLPASYKSEKDGEYISYLRETFEQNYQSDKYQFALLACHMLYMSFVYFSIWQIKNTNPDDFAKSLIGFSKDDEKKLLEASSPFAFSVISETRIFRFLKLVGCENEAIGKFSSLVQQRNDIAHPNGNIYYNDNASADARLSEILTQIDAIQQCMTPLIHKCIECFLSNTINDIGPIYIDTEDQIREVLIHSNYFSEKDIEACLSYNINAIEDEKIREYCERLLKILSDKFI